MNSLVNSLTLLLYRWRIVVVDLLAIPFAWLGAFWLRYNLEAIPEAFWKSAIYTLPVVIGAQAVINLFIGVHRGEWRFVSLPDLTLILRSVALGTMVMAFMLFFVADRLTYVPRSVFILYALILGGTMCASRLIYRLVKDQHFATKAGRKVVIIGAGAAGEQLLRDLKRNHADRYNIVAYLDDDTTKIGRHIHRVPVVASPEVLQEIVMRWGIDLVLIAVPSANDEQMQRLVSICEAVDIEYRTLPGVHELLSGKVTVGDMRQVRIEDLLGRDPVKLDWQRIKHSLCDKRVLVTGAGGSIGSELCRQLAAVCSAHLILFDHSEFNLYQIETELSERFPEMKITPILGDACDRQLLQRIFEDYRPTAVFHAAAYKHVPLLQDQPRAVVKNNIFGTKLVADLSKHYKVEKFVLISTDKAVNPTSLMGASKRVAEIYCQHLATLSESKFITVRFGNVLGSAGSVVPRFQQQIAKGGPVTVTHKDMTRYFMTITEATQLILEASAMGEDGRIYVLDMGTPILISDLAKQMIRLSGKEPDVDIKIAYTGLRAGEKLHEELFHDEETVTSTAYEKINLAQTREVSVDTISSAFAELVNNVQSDNPSDEAFYQTIKTLVPEYQIDNSETERAAAL